MSRQTSSYEEIADEYYDPRHITSRNFDAATMAFLESWRCPILPNGPVLVVGAGRGTGNPYFMQDGNRIIHTDISYSMLTLSPREDCKVRVQCDALALPFASNTFAAVTAFLFDPYNKPAFYVEVSRVLARQGVFLGTFPHYEWGITLRQMRGYAMNKARLVTQDGRVLERDSFLMNDEEISQNLISVELQLAQSLDLRLPRSEEGISPDIMDPAEVAGRDPYDLPIMKLIVARKP